MGEKIKDKSTKVEKKIKKDKKEKKEKKSKSLEQEKAANGLFSLLADQKAVDPTLSSLFAANPTPPTRAELPANPEPASEEEEDEAEDEGDDPDVELSELDEDLDDEDDEPIERVLEEAEDEPEAEAPPEHESKRKRKRKDAGDDLESRYMQKLEKEEAKEAEQAAIERAAKRQKSAVAEMGVGREEESSDDDVEVEIEHESDDEPTAMHRGAESEDEDDEKAASPPPKHETQQQADNELFKAQRTVFLGNVSTSAITNKSNRRLLIAHLCSFFDKIPKSKDDTAKSKLESIRFRSTPFASAIPKKAAFAKKELMDATTKSTNAYAVYSNPQLAREAARRLNATVVLDRHLRVDSIAHPAKTDHRRCVFVGNLGFVDDESNIQAANAEAGRERTRKPSKQPADVEEGLWRTFSRHGAVESVRVIRDSKTRVGIGIAYVQFVDENSVEAALLDDEKKFPPMLPRKLRVQRAKAMKRNAKPGSGRPGASKDREAASGGKSGYKRKITAEEASQMGRTGKLYGKAAAAALHIKPQRRPVNGSAAPRKPGIRGDGGIKAPESFVFEGHRATAKQGKSGLKFGKKGSGTGGKKQGKPTNRSAKRGAAFKAGGGKKARDS